jgi:hypothetical protein
MEASRSFYENAIKTNEQWLKACGLKQETQNEKKQQR